MNEQLVNMVWESALTRGQKNVLSVLALHSDCTGFVAMTFFDLALKSGYTRQGLGKVMSSLIDLGVVNHLSNNEYMIVADNIPEYTIDLEICRKFFYQGYINGLSETDIKRVLELQAIIDGVSSSEYYKSQMDDRRRYRANGNDRARARTHKMRALANGGKHIPYNFRDVFERCGNKCLSCGATDRELVIDHIVPISLGGDDAEYNVQPLCASCNSKKRVKDTDYRRNRNGN